MNKPPIGPMPEKIWTQKNPYPKPSDISLRVESLEAALWRYHEVRMPVPSEWTDELVKRREQLGAWQ